MTIMDIHRQAIIKLLSIEIIQVQIQLHLLLQEIIFELLQVEMLKFQVRLIMIFDLLR